MNKKIKNDESVKMQKGEEIKSKWKKVYGNKKKIKEEESVYVT